MPEREPVPFELPRPPRRIPARVKLLGGVAGGVVAVVLAVVAFGGSGGGPLGPVAQAATVSTSEPGYTMHMTMSMGVAGSPAVTATGSGTMNLLDSSGSLSMGMSAANNQQLSQLLGSGKLAIREILEGTKIYMQFPAAMMQALPGGKQWLSLDLAKLPGMSGIGSLMSNPASTSPGQMLQYLRAASGNVVTVGQDQVDGYQTTHYSADIDLSRVADALPGADKAAAQQMLSTLRQMSPLSQIPVNVWVDGQHLVRRLEMSMDTTVQGAAMNMFMTIDFPHYGAEPTPAAPPAGQVADLGSLLSGLGSSGSSSGSSSGAFFGTGA